MTDIANNTGTLTDGVAATSTETYWDSAIDVEAYALHAVFERRGPISGDVYPDEIEELLDKAKVQLRGCYDLTAFHPDADLLLWLIAESPEYLQHAYQLLHRSKLAPAIHPKWTALSRFMPESGDQRHRPYCFKDSAALNYAVVQPINFHCEWYLMPAGQRLNLDTESGQIGHKYPQVKLSKTAAFGLGNYDWIYTWEADQVPQLMQLLRAQRETELQVHIASDKPIFFGSKVSFEEWIRRQP